MTARVLAALLAGIQLLPAALAGAPPVADLPVGIGPPLPAPPPAALLEAARDVPGWLEGVPLRALPGRAAEMLGGSVKAAQDPLLMHPAFAAVAPDLRDWLRAPARAVPPTLSPHVLASSACLGGEDLATDEVVEGSLCYEAADIVFRAPAVGTRSWEVPEGASLTIRGSTLRVAGGEPGQYGLLRVRGDLVLEDSVLEGIVVFAEHGDPLRRETSTQSIEGNTFRGSPRAIVTDRDNVTIRGNLFVGNTVGIQVLPPQAGAPRLAMSAPEVESNGFEMNGVGVLVDTDQVAGNADPVGRYEGNELRANLVGIACYSNGWTDAAGTERALVRRNNVHENWGDALSGLRGTRIPTFLGSLVIPDSSCRYETNYVGADSEFLSPNDVVASTSGSALPLAAPALPHPVRVLTSSVEWSDASLAPVLDGPVVVASGGTLRITQSTLAAPFPVGAAPGGRLEVEGTTFLGAAGLVLRNAGDTVEDADVRLAGAALDGITVYRSSASVTGTDVTGSSRLRSAGVSFIGGLFELGAWTPRLEGGTLQEVKYGVVARSSDPTLEGLTVRRAATPDQAMLQGGLLGAGLAAFAATVTSEGSLFERTVNGVSALFATFQSTRDTFDRGFAGINSATLNTLVLAESVVANQEFGLTTFPLDYELSVDDANITYNAIGVLNVVTPVDLDDTNFYHNYLLAIYPYPTTLFGTPSRSSATCDRCWAPPDEAWMDLYGSSVAWRNPSSTPKAVRAPSWAAQAREVAGEGAVLALGNNTALEGPVIARAGGRLLVEGARLDLNGFALGAKGAGRGGGPTGELAILDATITDGGFVAMNSTDAVVRSSTFEGFEGGAGVFQVLWNGASFECNQLNLAGGSPGRVLDLLGGSPVSFTLNTFHRTGDLEVGLGLGGTTGTSGDMYHQASVVLEHNRMQEGTSRRGLAYLGQNGTHVFRDNLLESNAADMGMLRTTRNWTAGARNPAVVPAAVDASGTYWGAPSGPIVDFRGRQANASGAAGLRLSVAPGSIAWPEPLWRDFGTAVPATPPCVLFRVAPDPLVEGGLATLTDHTSLPEGAAAARTWDFGDGSPPVTTAAAAVTHTFADSGTYTVILTVDLGEGLAGSSQRLVEVLDATPLADFAADVLDEASAVAFEDRSTHPGPNDQPPGGWTYAWDFAGLGTSALRHPSFPFPEGGSYEVTLEVADADGVRDDVTRTVVVPHAAPVPDFAAEAADELADVVFADATTHPNPADQDPAGWTFAWDFAGQGASAAQSPAFRFADGGTHQVTLTVTDDDGIAEGRTKGVEVPHAPPRADFGAAALDELAPVAFADATTHPNPADQDPAGWTFAWDFAGLGASAERNPLFRFPDGGSHTVALRVTDNDGVADPATRVVEVPHVPPRPAFAAGPGSELDALAFADLTSHPNPADQDPAGWTYAWDFGGLGSSAERHPTFRFPDGGTYDVTLTVTDNDGAADSVTKPVEVAHAAPLADFAAEVEDELTPLAFTDLTTHRNPGDQDPATWTYAWGFGGLGSSAERHPTFRFPDGGTHRVTLSVTDNDGLTTTTVQDLDVPHAAPLPRFRAHVREGPVVQFLDLSAHPNAADAPPAGWAYSWALGDGRASAEREPLVGYAGGGVVTVALEVTDDDGQAASFALDVNLSDLSPRADFHYAPARASTMTVVRFTDASQDDHGVVDWVWDFGDGSPPARGREVMHTFPRGGDYAVTLQVTDGAGTMDLRTRTVHVCAPPGDVQPDLPERLSAEVCMPLRV